MVPAQFTNQQRSTSVQLHGIVYCQYTSPTPTWHNCRVESRRRCVYWVLMLGRNFSPFRSHRCKGGKRFQCETPNCELSPYPNLVKFINTKIGLGLMNDCISDISLLRKIFVKICLQGGFSTHTASHRPTWI